MKVTIITAVLNSVTTIEDCIRSVCSQSYPNIEHIIIDGGSTDGTIEVIKRYMDSISMFISEPDNGMYDAINKGLMNARGDVVGILNADDFYANEKVIEKIVEVFKKNGVDSCYGDLIYVDKEDPDKIVRYWKSKPFRSISFMYGWHPPHPTFFVRKWVYDKYGFFNPDFKIAGDYELMLRFIEKNKISTSYIPEVLVKMRIGGISNKSLKNIILQTCEDYKAWRLNGLHSGFFAVFLKKIRKIFQFFQS